MNPTSAQGNQPSQGGVAPPPPSNPPPSTPDQVSPQAEAAAERKLLKPVAIALVAITGVLFFLIIGLVIFGQGIKPVHDISQQVIPPQILPDDTPTPTPRRATIISGNIVFQGYASEDAYLVIVERAQGESQFKSIVTGLNPAVGNIPWSWSDAAAGTNYEIQAQLKIKGITVQDSAITTISAPATGVAIQFVSDQDPPAPQQTTLNGTVNINGYIPTSATVNIVAQSGSSTAQNVASGIQAVDDTTWSWNGATVGTSYYLVAQLVSGGTVLASSVAQNITAPATNITFDINSTAQPPQPTIVGISGTISLNGNIPSNSYITLGTRVTGSSSFNQVGSNLTASNGVAWSWNGAQSGTSYDAQAYLWSNGKPYAASNIMTNIAPANGIVLAINAQQSIAAPAQNTLSVSCNGQQNNQYQATINYNTNSALTNVSSYQVVVTQASGGNQVINTTLTPGNPNQQQTLTTGYQFTSGATYYAQYGYTSNGTTSPLSPSVQFSCN